MFSQLQIQLKLLLIKMDYFTTLPPELIINIFERLDIVAKEHFTKAFMQNPDIVVICNPTSMHLDILIHALKKGCHIYIEKP